MILLLSAALASAEPPAVVSSLQTPQLVDACRGKDADPTANFCTGYVIGALDALSLSHQICLSPARASTIDAVAVARKYLRTHRRTWSSAPSFIIRDALKAAFPCKEGRKPRPDKPRSGGRHSRDGEPAGKLPYAIP